MTYDIEHLFMCLLAIRMSSSVKCLFMLSIFELDLKKKKTVEFWEFSVYSSH